MASNRRKSAAVALAILGVAGLSLASASQLNLTSTTVQAGSVVVADCQPTSTPIAVTYTTSFTSPDYKVATVKLAGIDAACNGKALEVKVLDSTGAALATMTSASVTSGTMTLTPAATFNVNSLARIAAVING